MEDERALRCGRRSDVAVEGRKVIEKEDQSTRGERGREVWREGARRIGMEPWERQSRSRE